MSWFPWFSISIEEELAPGEIGVSRCATREGIEMISVDFLTHGQWCVRCRVACLHLRHLEIKLRRKSCYEITNLSISGYFDVVCELSSFESVKANAE
jgi:hypothetical protein